VNVEVGVSVGVEVGVFVGVGVGVLVGVGEGVIVGVLLGVGVLEALAKPSWAAINKFGPVKNELYPDSTSPIQSNCGIWIILQLYI